MSLETLKCETTSAWVVNHILDELQCTSEMREKLLEQTEISSRSLKGVHAKISVFGEWVFIKNVSKLKGDDWVWRNPEIWKAAEPGPFTNAVSNAPNCADALNIITRFGHLLGANLYFEQFSEITARGVQRLLTLGLIPDVNHKEYGSKSARDISMLRVFYLLDRLLGSNSSEVEIRISGPSHASANARKTQFSRLVTIGGERDGFSVASKSCDKMVQGRNPLVFNRAMAALNKLEGPSKSADDLMNRVKVHLSSVTSGRPSAEDVALHLGVSQRTLNRRLQEAGTSFRLMLDASLEKRALRYLSANSLSRSQISESLGYSDQASFSRALRRWSKNV